MKKGKNKDEEEDEVHYRRVYPKTRITSGNAVEAGKGTGRRRISQSLEARSVCLWILVISVALDLFLVF